MNDYVQSYCRNAKFEISITPNSAMPVLDLCDYEQYTSGKSLYDEDRSVRTFLEMVIGQYSVNNNVYTPIGPGRLFVTSEDMEEIDSGIVLRTGVAKGVRVVQNDGKPKPALVLDGRWWLRLELV